MCDPRDAWLEGEPDVAVLLADPIFSFILRCDGLCVDDVRRAIAAAQARLRASEAKQPAAA